MFRHTRTKLTFPLVYSEAVKKNYVIHYHLMSVYCVLPKIIWVLTEMQVFFMKHTYFNRVPKIKFLYDILTKWTIELSGSSNCVGQVPLLQIHDILKLSDLFTWHLSYTVNIPSPQISKEFPDIRAPVLYFFFCCLIILYSTLYTKRYTVNMLITGWKYI